MDILERLRAVQNNCAQYVAGSDIMRDAADEITRQRAELECLRGDNRTATQIIYARDEAISELRAELEAAKGATEALRKGIVAVSYLMDHSDGVYGMHLNGDPSPWAELRTGGRFESWLVEFDDAIAAIDAARGKDNE